ncbi:ABC transporter family substrate-binding protein [Corynebacterium sp. CCUG 70398]|uniref:ABC transporter family substrate-binding protein n=1 Tax=Corynebacterium sp. CCUG 70398 TaxID=2823891 RepID=UPI00210C7C09|nr:ABC transporter family substrate-binding protein [Corynebacterium sp. CCUG 70398]MCQ4621838.1 ABC transporter family substrate-binding protein [Corynebacterium sp. CCUG 70398]
MKAVRLTTVTLASISLLSSCAANPGPPPIVEETVTTETATTTVQPGPTRSQVQVGVQPLRNGLNPHLIADENSTVQDIAELTLPSAFLDGKMNTDLLVSASELPDGEGDEDAAMTVRYEISPAAQWSDGSPITGADFAYLWRGMTSTPGTVDPAPYRAVSDVRVSGGGGKIVDVVFDEPVGDWQGMFRNLLPSHLFDSTAADFAAALADSIPASAGRYMVDQVDRGSGIITLNRNDRFWGQSPASIDILTLNSVRSTEQVADRLRAGQLAFVDHVPGETSADAYSLIPGTQVRTERGPRELGLVMSVDSPVLNDLAAREELRSLIDVPLIARIASSRSRDVDAAEATPALGREAGELRAAVDKHRPLRIAADPRDDESMPATRALVDILNGEGISAETVAADMTDIAERLPAGEIDAVMSWSFTNSSTAWASKVQCPYTAATEAGDSGAQDSGGDGANGNDAGGAGADRYASGNLSGLCTPDTDRLAEAILAGDISSQQAREQVTAATAIEAVWVPVLRERRIIVLGQGIIGPSPNLEEWDRGLAGADTWKEDTTANEQRTTEPE